MAIVIDYVNELILFTSPTTEMDGQTLHDFIQDEAATPVGMGQPWIDQADPQDDTEILYPDGKIEDPSNPGVYSQIILRLNSRWQMQFWGGSGYSRVYGAKIVGGVSGEVMKATGTAGDITVLESPVDGVTVGVGGSSGLTTEEHDHLLALDTTNLDVLVSSRLAAVTYVAPDNAGIANIETKVDLANSSLTTIDGKIDIIDSNVLDIKTNTINIEQDTINIESKIDILDAIIDTIDINVKSIESKVDIIDTVVDTINTDVVNLQSSVDASQVAIDIIVKLTGNNVTRLGDIITIYEDDKITVWRKYNVANKERIQV